MVHKLKMRGAVGTVSKALNNISDISEKVKLKIRALAKSLDYSPNSLQLL
jgi:DNA-binding LacI/PurR family transcriptional regulator|tara:strand:- start:478 stop:627 length:150 start_codon:yes stop_codon:yes gene_type:complete